MNVEVGQVYQFIPDGTKWMVNSMNFQTSRCCIMSLDGFKVNKDYPISNLLYTSTWKLLDDNSTEKSMGNPKIADRLLDEDTKALIEAGYLDSSLNLTTSGKEVMQYLDFKVRKNRMVKLAKKEIAARKSSSCQ